MGRTTTQANKRALAASELRQTEVFRRYCQQQSFGLISRQMGISKSTAIRDVDRALSKCVERNSADIDRIKAEALAQSQLIKAEAWRGWYRSMRDDRSESHTDGSSDKGGYSSTTTQRTRGKGDPRYLAQVTKCVEFECKLLGVLTSERDTGSSAGPMVQFVEIVVENRQQRDEILTFDEFKARRKSHAS